jgi:hypothetical protein
MPNGWRARDDRTARTDQPEAITACWNRGFDAADFVWELRQINVTLHIAQNTSRRSAIDGRTTRQPGYAMSQRLRKRIEEGFGWMKTIAGLKKTNIAGWTRSNGHSPWRLQLTISSACQN